MQPNTPPTQADNLQANSSASRLAKLARRIFFATLVLAPIFFIPSRLLAVDLAKTAIIVAGTLVSSVLYAVVFFKERKVIAPPKAIFLTSLLLCLSAIVSAALSIHAGKSFFGQGFEIGTAAFLLISFLGAFVSYETVRRNPDSSVTVFMILNVVFAVFFLLHLSRLIFGTSFLSLGILSSQTATLLGKWPELAMFAILILITISGALAYLPLSKRAKMIFYGIGAVSFLTAVAINHTLTWVAAAVTFGIIAIAAYFRNPKAGEGAFRGFMSRISWIPAVICILAIVMTWRGTAIAGPFAQKTGTQYSELSLPWQMTLDVISGSIKNYPLFGVGPNHFAQAFMAYKPQGLNSTNLWSVEFSSGFGTIPTYMATLGGVGTILWILFFVFLGIAVANSWKKMPDEPHAKFTVVSAAAATIFLWLMSVLYAPSHAMFFLTFAMTGLFLAASVSYGMLKPFRIAPAGRLYEKVIMPGACAAFIAACVAAFLIYGKKTVAMAYFAKGVNDITVGQKFDAAGRAFERALSFDASDVYWQAISENDRLKAAQMVSSATSSSPALAEAVAKTVSDGVQAARNAIAYDPSNYYNLVSEARVSQLGATLKITNAYDNAVRAYADAIKVNPQNPALYVNLAQLQASNNNLDQALQTLGSALQVKNNYLDAVFLLSQVQAAKGNLPDAIIAAQVAIQLNPQNPLLYFQLGLLEYNAQNYKVSAQAFAKAVQLQPDYANAKYFLGLSAARNSDLATAIAQFDDLSKSNPDNREVALVLANLRAGKSPFANVQPPAAPAPEKRPALPVKEKK